MWQVCGRSSHGRSSSFSIIGVSVTMPQAYREAKHTSGCDLAEVDFFPSRDPIDWHLVPSIDSRREDACQIQLKTSACHVWGSSIIIDYNCGFFSTTLL